MEAKIVFSENVVLSLGSEFIENEKEDVVKQDCEIHAAKRLLEKIKKDDPRLPICVQGDILYATEPFMKLCSKTYHWKYLFTQISDILMQLYLAWNPYIKELKQTIKNTSSGLLESFRRLTVTAEDVSYTLRYTTVYLE